MQKGGHMELNLKSLEMQNKIIVFICWWRQKISHVLDKIYKYIWKILLSSFRNWYG